MHFIMVSYGLEDLFKRTLLGVRVALNVVEL